MASLFELRLPEFGIERMGGGAIIAVRGLAAMEGVELERLGGAIMASRGLSTSVIFWGCVRALGGIFGGAGGGPASGAWVFTSALGKIQHWRDLS